MAMEKSWNMMNWQKSHGCCEQSWDFTNFDPRFDLRLEHTNRLENLENKYGHGKLIEHEKCGKSHGILLICPKIFTKFLKEKKRG